MAIDRALEIHNLRKQNKNLIDDLKEANQNLEKSYEEWKGDIEQIDDILVFGIKFIKA